MNNLYVQDRMNRNNTDFEGSGIGEGRYDEREEKKFKLSEIKLPIILLTMFTICLGVIIYMSLHEVILYNTGTPVTATFSSGTDYATFKAPDEHNYTVATSWALADDNAKTITVYYPGDNYQKAQPMSSAIYWIIIYVIFIMLFALTAFWIFKILHKSNHATATEESRKHYY